MGVEIFGDVAESFGLIEGVVDPFDEDEFEGDHPTMFFAESADGRDQFGERVSLIDRHDLRTHFIGRAVERDREANPNRFVGELQNIRHKAAGGKRDAASTEPEAPIGIDDFERGGDGFVVGKRLAQAHDDDVVERGEAGVGAWIVGILAVADMQELCDDLSSA